MSDKQNKPLDFNALMARISPQRMQEIAEKTQIKADVSDLIFTTADLNEDIEPLARILRIIMIRRGYTYTQYKIDFAEMADRNFMDANTINHRRNNLLRTIKSSNIKWDMFTRVMEIMRLGFLEMNLSLNDLRTGEAFDTKASADTEKLLDKNQFTPQILIDEDKDK